MLHLWRRQTKTKTKTKTKACLMSYTQEFVLDKAKKAFEAWKAVNPLSVMKQKNYKEKLPEYWTGFTAAVENCEHIGTHAIYGKFPEKLFANRAPNQTEKEMKYLKENYKQVTLPVFVDYVATITRGDNPNNVQIKYDADDTAYENEKSLRWYLENGIKDYGSLEVWRKNILPSVKSIDSMGIIAVKPYDIPLKQEEPTEENPEPEPYYDPDTLLEPIPVYYCVDKLVAYESDEYYMVELEEKSLVDSGAKKDDRIGKIYEFYDDDNIWRVEQYGKFNDGLFKAYVYFNHAEDVVPVTQLMGIPVSYKEKVVWQSPFIYSVDLLDLVALNSSYLEASIANCVYPYAVAVGSECTYEHKSHDGQVSRCNDGMVFNYDTGKNMDCPACEGVGLRDRRSRLGVLLINPGKPREGVENMKADDVLKFISPEVHTLQFVQDKIAKDEERARKILHLQTSNSMTKGTENMTATGMSLDNQAMQAFVKTQSDQVWNIYKYVVDRIGWQRYGNAYKKPVIVQPSTFEFRTPDEYQQSVIDAINSKAPPFMIRTLMLKYLQSVFYNQHEALSVFDIVVHADRLLTMDSQDIAIGLAKGTVAKWEVILHDSVVQIIQNLMLENTGWLDKELGEKIDDVIAKAKETASAIQGEQPQTGTQGIINSLTA